MVFIIKDKMTGALGDNTDKIQCPQEAYNLAEKPSTRYINCDSFIHLSIHQNLLSTYYDSPEHQGAYSLVKAVEYTK